MQLRAAPAKRNLKAEEVDYKRPQQGTQCSPNAPSNQPGGSVKTLKPFFFSPCHSRQLRADAAKRNLKAEERL